MAQINSGGERGVLVIIPCGKAKVWDRDPSAGAVAAQNAYTGGPFKVNKAFAQATGTSWRILSAKYGLIAGDFPLPGPYDTTFKDPRTVPITTERLILQIQAQDLQAFERVICLGGKEYLRAAREAFLSFGIRIEEPFAGLPIGKAMQAIQAALRGSAPPRPRPILPASAAEPDLVENAINLAMLVPPIYPKRLPGVREFRAMLEEIFASEAEQGAAFVDVVAGDLHRRAGGGSGRDNRMPPCCDVMRSQLCDGDEILYEPPQGRGSRLACRYRLPRYSRWL